MYLKDLGFEEDIVNLLEANLPDNAIRSLNDNKETVINNVNCLIELGVYRSYAIKLLLIDPCINIVSSIFSSSCFLS